METVVVAPQDSWLLDCPVEKPPTEIEKKAMTKAYIKQTYNLHSCNADKQALREWKRETLKLYEN